MSNKNIYQKKGVTQVYRKYTGGETINYKNGFTVDFTQHSMQRCSSVMYHYRTFSYLP